MDSVTTQASARFWEHLTPAQYKALIDCIQLAHRLLAEMQPLSPLVVQLQRQAVKDTFRGAWGL